MEKTASQKKFIVGGIVQLPLNYCTENFILKIIYIYIYIYIYKGKGKVKAIPLQAWTDPEGSKSLRLPAFKTFGT